MKYNFVLFQVIEEIDKDPEKNLCTVIPNFWSSADKLYFLLFFNTLVKGGVPETCKSVRESLEIVKLFENTEGRERY